MNSLVLTIHIIACLILIVVVLVQSGKEGMGVIFGGGSGSVFGSSGAGGLLVKITTFVAVLFLITSLAYNKLSGPKSITGDSVMSGVEVPAPVEEKKPAVIFEEPAKQEEAKQ